MTRSASGGEPRQAVEAWLMSFGAAVAGQDIDRLVELFAERCYWRDLVSFTWNVVTVEDRPGVKDLLVQTLEQVGPSDFAAVDTPVPPSRVDGAEGVVQGWFRFATRVGRGVGQVRLDENGRAWTLFTTLAELDGHEPAVGARRALGTSHVAGRERATWEEERRREIGSLGVTQQPYVLVVGGGQAGLSLAARLRYLGVSCVIIDRNEAPGDTWRNRYRSLVLHDPVWHNHLPYLEFPPTWPVFTPKDKLADWLDAYARLMELHFWGSTEFLGGAYDEAANRWDITIRRGEEGLQLRPHHLVFAMGISGKPRIPVLEGQHIFRGDQHHSSDHPDPEAYVGKKVVVLGANNSAHDICAALWEAGVDVTMVQRSSTLVVRSKTLVEFAIRGLYSEEAAAQGLGVAEADLVNASTPFALLPQFQVPLWNRVRDHDAEFYQRLRDAGFALDFGDDDSGLWLKFLRRGSGYYIDVGACDLVARGEIKLQSPAEAVRLTEQQVVLSNGVTLDADAVIYATGYDPMSAWVADLVSPEVAERVGRVWGLGSGTAKDPGPWQGELLNMYKPTAQEGLWFHGGNLYQARQYSHYLALQIKGRKEGLVNHVYGASAEAPAAPVHRSRPDLCRPKARPRQGPTPSSTTTDEGVDS